MKASFDVYESIGNRKFQSSQQDKEIEEFKPKRIKKPKRFYDESGPEKKCDLQKENHRREHVAFLYKTSDVKKSLQLVSKCSNCFEDLCNPVTNCSAERSFQHLQELKIICVHHKLNNAWYNSLCLQLKMI
ncbi:hypothetical protein PR048_009348 [Dryococelus australis]|uniref:Recombination activating protein 1 n=1 Tax=Dryococelus australis TaxID=614101 RepID=A0ABQ9HZN9_9NEOP|nr:hypothetical protein PR048_009348 [Dryococelus australis]